MQDREYLTGQLLIAMPSMRDARFARTVIYVCAHHPDGAMGLVINRLVGAITFPDLLAQLGIGPLAIGQDGGGSIRRPASHAGVGGLKPSLSAVCRLHSHSTG